MNTIIGFLKSLFAAQPSYVLGAFETVPDDRNIPLASVQAPVAIPQYFMTDMPPVEDQGSKPICVAEAITTIAELHLKKKGIVVELSPDDLYEQCKLIDGNPNPGTYPAIGAKVAFNTGIASKAAYASGDKAAIAADRVNHRIGGYAFVNPDYQSVCQAIYQNGAISATFDVDQNWFAGIITKALKSVGRHNVDLDGYDQRVFNEVDGMNSWGIRWIGKAAGMISPSVKPGHFSMNWDDATPHELIACADIPQPVINAAKAKSFAFETDMRQGSAGYDVSQLQARLIRDGYAKGFIPNGIFGPLTTGAVIAFQKAHGLPETGNVFSLTRAALNAAAGAQVPNGVVITRQKTLNETMGKLVATRNGDAFSCVTGELKWLDNRPDISCIPPGTYRLKFNHNPAAGMVHYQVMDVPQRAGIYIHNGNYATPHEGNPPDIEGCILLGTSVVDINGDGIIDVSGSADAVLAFERFLNYEDAMLTIL